MKNRLGNPDFLVRLNSEAEKNLIALAKKFGTESYPKTILAVAMRYEPKQRELQTLNAKQNQEIKKLKQLLNESNKKNTSLMSKVNLFVKLVDKISDIKPQLRIFRISPARSKK
jgi:hypothetical protein